MTKPSDKVYQKKTDLFLGRIINIKKPYQNQNKSSIILKNVKENKIEFKNSDC